MIYEITYEFQTGIDAQQRVVRSAEIHIRTTSDFNAVKGCVAFWKNRHVNVPEYFGVLFSVNVYEFDPQPLGANGELMSDGCSRKVFEWKSITGCGPGVTFGSKLIDNPMTDMFNDKKATGK